MRLRGRNIRSDLSKKRGHSPRAALWQACACVNVSAERDPRKDRLAANLSDLIVWAVDLGLGVGT